jgi:hypothetical protein
MINGVEQIIHEIAVTDARALCFYAHSGLFTGAAAARDELLSELCGEPISHPDDCGLGSGSYALAGVVTRTTHSEVTSGELAVDVTLCFGPQGRSVEVVSISGAGTSSLMIVGSDPPATQDCTSVADLVVNGTAGQGGEPRLTRYSGLNTDAAGPSSAGNLFAASLATCTDPSNGTRMLAGVESVGSGTHVVESGRIVAIDFGFESDDASVVGQLVPVSP